LRAESFVVSFLLTTQNRGEVNASSGVWNRRARENLQQPPKAWRNSKILKKRECRDIALESMGVLWPPV